VIQGIRFLGKEIADTFDDFCLNLKVSLPSGYAGGKLQNDFETYDNNDKSSTKKKTLPRCNPVTNPPIREDQFDVLLDHPEVITPGHWCQIDVCLNRLSSDPIVFERKEIVREY
jgi:hypothetical protein